MSQASIPSFTPRQFGGPRAASSPDARRHATRTSAPLVVVGGLGGAAFGGLVTLLVAATGVLAGTVTPFAVMGFGTVGAALIGALAGRLVLASTRQAERGWL